MRRLDRAADHRNRVEQRIMRGRSFCGLLQFAALTKMLFPPEPRYPLTEIPSTMLVFTDGYGRTSGVFKPDLCYGKVTGAGDARIIPAVLENGLGGTVTDAILGNGYIDWACVLEQHVEYLGTDAFPGMIQVEQTILFWGDIQIIRQ